MDPQEHLRYERKARSRGAKYIAGIDEAGRGPLAGPVFAAACIIPEGIFFSGVNDSKQLNELQRERLFLEITSHSEVIYGIGRASHEEIDQINIYQATKIAMRRAIDALSVVPDCLLVDGMELAYLYPSEKIIKGDTLSHSIAAASVIAKYLRDRLMCEYGAQWPQYGFTQHKGYGTRQHLQAIREHGPCPIHRMTFAPLKNLEPES